MASKSLSHDEFFSKLGALLSSRQSSQHGAIYLVQKRLSYGQDAEMSDAKEGQTEEQLTQSPVIVRATNGKSKRNRAEKIKISTVVEPGDLEGFYVRYGEVCKTGMTALKPRDRSKKKAKAKKKKTAAA
ncbi:hypothetical protein VHEMI09012 [[Torrubiella] hemipterigena]|uniref:Signal recognition particle subunit SRP14 n=1 Tax=[Torrubiella] hemipterigena TaxID=1531966 RepID=A0A0A1TQQ3_9HYPO|nr:hypothetical protein VHEMI09012 [[Torrubiella] hemipterigena]